MAACKTTDAKGPKDWRGAPRRAGLACSPCSVPHEAIAVDWYRRGFGALYPVVYAHRTLEAAGPEAAFAATQLELRPGMRVLDLCCGNGRHMAHLLRNECTVAGLDYSPDLLASARERLDRNMAIVRADMRAAPFGEVFDAVVSFFTSFGYFAAREENLRVVYEMARVLKPGGKYLIDYLNASFVENNLVPQSSRACGDYTVHEARWIDRDRRRVNKHTTVTRDHMTVGAWDESVQLYSADEFRALLAQGGLEVDRMFGDFDGTPLGDERPRMIVVGHKG